jgi:hypothetical protein
MCVMSENTISPQPNLFAADSLAKMLVLQEKERGFKAIDQHSGQSSIVLFAKFSPDGSLLKTYSDYFQVTLDNSLQKFSGNFPRAGILRNGKLYQRQPLALRTNEKESLSWGTPRAYQSSTMSFGKATTTHLAKVRHGAHLIVRTHEWLMGFPPEWVSV